jgi:hypothetical protein
MTRSIEERLGISKCRSGAKKLSLSILTKPVVGGLKFRSFKRLLADTEVLLELLESFLEAFRFHNGHELFEFGCGSRFAPFKQDGFRRHDGDT